jgi:hypothetical protein
MAWVDYDQLAAVYDCDRAVPLEALEPWRAALAAYLPPASGLPVLDLEAGTGLFSVAIAQWFGTDQGKANADSGRVGRRPGSLPERFNQGSPQFAAPCRRHPRPPAHTLAPAGGHGIGAVRHPGLQAELHTSGRHGTLRFIGTGAQPAAVIRQLGWVAARWSPPRPRPPEAALGRVRIAGCPAGQTGCGVAGG